MCIHRDSKSQERLHLFIEDLRAWCIGNSARREELLAQALRDPQTGEQLIVFHYLDAIEEGDWATLDRLLQAALSNHHLEDMLLEVHREREREVTDAPPPRISLVQAQQHYTRLKRSD